MLSALIAVQHVKHCWHWAARQVQLASCTLEHSQDAELCEGVLCLIELLHQITGLICLLLCSTSPIVGIGLRGECLHGLKCWLTAHSIYRLLCNLKVRA